VTDHAFAHVLIGEPASTSPEHALEPVVAAQRRIWLIADDYGISPAVSAAIRDLAARGRLSGTSVMVTAPSFDRAQA